MSMNNQEIAPTLIANIDHIKQVNSATIYKVIEQYAPISRVAIAKVSKLAPASVTKITRQLIENGLISETERQESTGGRRAISLAPNSDNINIVAIKLGQKLLSISHYNLSGENLFSKQTVIPIIDNSDQLIDFLTSEIAKFITQPRLINQKISAIAITLSGLIDPKNGLVLYTPTYPLTNYPLVEIIHSTFNIPTFIGNHTRSLALAENYFGATRDNQDSVLISIHHGVGSGVIVDNKVLLGKSCNIGEIGHIQTNPTGKRCHCGNQGCLETEVSDPIIFAKVKAGIQAGMPCCLDINTMTINDIYRAAAKHDNLCQSITEEAAVHLGKNIAILVNLLSPQKIVISGKIIQAGEVLFAAIEKCINQQTLSDFRQKLVVIPAELEPDTTIAAFSLIKNAIYEGDLLQKIKI